MDKLSFTLTSYGVLQTHWDTFEFYNHITHSLVGKIRRRLMVHSYLKSCHRVSGGVLFLSDEIMTLYFS